MHGFCAPHITSNWRNTMEYIIYTPPKTNIEVESGPGISPNGFREASQLVINNLKDCFSLTKLAKESWKLPSPAPHHHPHWVPTGTQWIQQAPNGSNRPPMDPTGPQWIQQAPNCVSEQFQANTLERADYGNPLQWMAGDTPLPSSARHGKCETPWLMV